MYSSGINQPLTSTGPLSQRRYSVWLDSNLATQVGPSIQDLDKAGAEEYGKSITTDLIYTLDTAIQSRTGFFNVSVSNFMIGNSGIIKDSDFAIGNEYPKGYGGSVLGTSNIEIRANFNSPYIQELKPTPNKQYTIINSDANFQTFETQYGNTIPIGTICVGQPNAYQNQMGGNRNLSTPAITPETNPSPVGQGQGFAFPVYNSIINDSKFTITNPDLRNLRICLGSIGNIYYPDAEGGRGTILTNNMAMVYDATDIQRNSSPEPQGGNLPFLLPDERLFNLPYKICLTFEEV
jgi:hypothetical protein